MIYTEVFIYSMRLVGNDDKKEGSHARGTCSATSSYRLTKHSSSFSSLSSYLRYTLLANSQPLLRSGTPTFYWNGLEQLAVFWNGLERLYHCTGRVLEQIEFFWSGLEKLRSYSNGLEQLAFYLAQAPYNNGFQYELMLKSMYFNSQE